MNFRRLDIGTRLSAGFGSILVSAIAMLAGAMASNATNRSAMLRTLALSAVYQSDAVAMQNALLNGAVAVRSATLQAEVTGAQKDQAEASRQRQLYLAGKKWLDAENLAPG